MVLPETDRRLPAHFYENILCFELHKGKPCPVRCLCQTGYTFLLLPQWTVFSPGLRRDIGQCSPSPTAIHRVYGPSADSAVLQKSADGKVQTWRY